MDGVLFKIDFEKAYDKVKWPFLLQTLRMKGFDKKWCDLIQNFIMGGSVGVRVNDNIGHFFQTRKGLRQGDPLSPILFNIVADMLAILISRAKEDGQVGSLIPHLVEGGVSILQYADDTILFMEHDLQKAINMKLILCIFEQLSGLKINFHKSEIFCFGKAKEAEDQYRSIFGCEVGSLPFKYLGIPIHYRKLLNKEWNSVEKRFGNKLGCWQGKLLSYGDRLVLINSVLTSLPMFMLSFLEIPKGVLKRLDFYRSRFFWQSDQNKQKYRLTKWNIVCRPKDQGGLGIEVLDIKNKCLLSKWLYKLINEEGVWQELLKNKYLQNSSLSQVTAKPTDSQFWKGLMGVKENFFSKGKFVVGNGQKTRFWEDNWLGEVPLAAQYPTLYSIARHKNMLVADALANSSVHIEFRRNLTGNKWNAWLHMLQRLIAHPLTNEEDNFIWKLTSTGLYSVKSLYEDYLNGHTVNLRKQIWKLKVPLKIKIFMWFLYNKVILTKDNLARRNWNGCKKCVFCDSEESIDHLFFTCPFAHFLWTIVQYTFNIVTPANSTNMFGNWLDGVEKDLKAQIRVGACALLWSIWRCRNDIIFNNARNANFLQVIRMATHWIHEWAFLVPEPQRAHTDYGCTRLEAVALDIYSRGTWRLSRRIQDV